MARVCQLTDDLKYYLCMEPVDMRKQFQGLQGIVNEEFGRYLGENGAFPPTRNGCIHSLSMRERG